MAAHFIAHLVALLRLHGTPKSTTSRLYIADRGIVLEHTGTKRCTFTTPWYKTYNEDLVAADFVAHLVALLGLRQRLCGAPDKV
jgi:hypothetical protein